MGIRDRDYMKRPSDDDGYSDLSSDSKAEEIAQKILKKYSKLILYCGIGLGILVVVALIIAEFSGGGH